MYLQYVNTVIATLKSERVIKEAMRNPAWKKHRPAPSDAYLGEWNRNLLIKTVPYSSITQIAYTDEHKDAQTVAPIAVQSLIKAYMDLYGDDEKIATDRKIAVWNNQKTLLEQKIHNNTTLVDQLLQNMGENPQFVYEEKLRAHLVLEQHLRELDEQLRIERGELKQAQDQAGTAPYSIEDLARVDPAMQEMYRIQSQLEMEVQELETRLGTANPAARAARERLNIRVQATRKYRDELRSKYFIKWKPDGTGGVLISKDLSLKEDAVKRMQDLYSTEKQFLEDLGRRSTEVHDLRAEQIKLDDELARVKKKIDELVTQEKMAQTFSVVDWGGQAALANDKRIAFGAVGFMAGGALPVALLLFASLMNPRFRYSDEATGRPTVGGLTLLGHPARSARSPQRPRTGLDRRPLRPSDPHDVTDQHQRHR